MVQARGQEDEALAVRLFHSEGYYDATALASLDQAGDGTLKAVISVTPGKRYKIGTIVITAGPTVPPTLVRDSLPLQTGDYIVAANVEGAEANVALKLPETGYPFAKVGERDILLDGATVTGDYRLPVDVGPRGTFRAITTSGDKQAFGADHMEVIRRYRPGDLYDSRKVDDLRKALVATGLFSSVAVEPVRTGEAGPDGTEYIDLHVEQEAGPPRTLAGELGYGTGQGFRAEGTWTHRNLFPPEGALIGGVVAGTQEQGPAADLQRQHLPPRPFACLLAWHVDTATNAELARIARLLRDAGCGYVCAHGRGSSRVGLVEGLLHLGLHRHRSHRARGGFLAEHVHRDQAHLVLVTRG